jgi:DNA helicase-2/ATP-dependent DNA helicase PcrA
VDKWEKKKLQLLYKLCRRLNRSITDQQLRRLSYEQLLYINHRLRIPCYVEACPGSGKTEVVGMKAAYEFADWRDRFAGIAILTFTRNAAAEIKARVVQYAGSEAARHPHFIGTIDSWLHNYLLQPFAHKITGYAGKNGDKSVRVIENESKAGFLNNYKVVDGQGGAILANEYYKKHDGGLEGTIRSIANFDQSYLASVKDRFLRDGFVSYQDAEYICYQVLKRHPIITKLLCQRFPYIIVDECQDLSDTQMYVFFELLKVGTALQLVGDLNQAIYEFRKVSPEHITSFVQKQGFHKKTLTKNFRSNQGIVDFCSRLIQLPHSIQGCESMVCDPSRILWQYTDETFESLPGCFSRFVASIELNSQRCCIVARGTALLKQLHPQKERRTSPVELFAVALNCWHLSNQSTTDVEIALHSVGKSLSLLAYSGRGYHQKQYCPDDLDPKAWRIFLADVLDNAVGLYPFLQEQSWSLWTRKLKSYLEGIWLSLPVRGREWSTISQRIRAPINRGRINIAEDMRLVSPVSNLRITTIHDVKGETFEALLLISAQDRKSKGGHFEQWLHPAPSKEEYQRFAYVACSRPKHLLVIATPPLDENQLQEFLDLGLEPQDMSLWQPSDIQSVSTLNGADA